jgi:hypothetical protein
MPPNGYWDGIFMQVTFPGPESTSLILTTETLTIPNTFPVGPCSGEHWYNDNQILAEIKKQYLAYQ